KILPQIASPSIPPSAMGSQLSEVFGLRFRRCSNILARAKAKRKSSGNSRCLSRKILLPARVLRAQNKPARRRVSQGVRKPLNSNLLDMKEIQYLQGDATSPQAKGDKIIAHICNDLGGWGKGFVLAVSRRWSEPEASYREWHRNRAAN